MSKHEEIKAAELLPCQCANSNVRITPAERPNTVPWHYWVECSCGNRGSIESTKECAIQQWNAQLRNEKHEADPNDDCELCDGSGEVQTLKGEYECKREKWKPETPSPYDLSERRIQAAEKGK